MRIYKFSITLTVITLLALLYVHQQVELLKISYGINTNEKETARLLDQNRSLMYNMTRLKSPVNLDKKFLAVRKDYAIPQQWQIVKVNAPSAPRQTVVRVAQSEKRTGGILKIFGRPKEAFANTAK
ncbi:MAG: hypothetical protein HY589_01935 [Candidatus Omnitrophica bacterium]|nr:hypothetical protein [Candidatus Omnitrophota bacterium]